MSNLKTFILEKVAQKELSSTQAAVLLAELNAVPKSETIDDIAIIGISCKLPLSDNADGFWKNVSEGVNCIGDWPEARRLDFTHVLKNQHYTELLFGDAIPPEEVKDGMYIKGGYLKEIDKFDADFFGIPPREARYMDPRQRLILESAWSAIEDAGYGGNRINGTKTGVFIGKENTNFTLYKFGTEPDPMHLTGGWVSIHASRISYLYNLTGPCMIIDTACSSGLASVHTAIQSIKNKECNMAIVGAINTSLNGVFKNHKEIVDLSSVQSDTGTVKTFDKKANGTVWGEGVVMLILKPLKDALADKDNIHSVIKGSAMNNDGASNGITAPNAEAQEEVILQAWKNAAVNPETINYVETHGTGTILGDPIEIKGLSGAFRKHTNKKQFCAIGSLKPNMGHLVATSGLASLIKVIMAMKNKKLPPLINFNSPNPYINFSDSPLYINDCLRDWEHGDSPRRSAVSSFGFSGTNIHVVLEEYDEQRVTKAKKENYCVTLSAKKESILKDYIRSYQNFVNHSKNWNLADLAYTSNIGRGHYAYRMGVIAKSKSEFIELINSIDCNSDLPENKPNVYWGYHKVVSDKKEKDFGEITISEKKNFSDSAQKLLAENNSLKNIIEIYVKGADINWIEIYKGEDRHIISSPVYPLERVRCWADYKKSKVSMHGQEFNHPLVEQCLVKSLNHEIYQTGFSLNKHWVLTDHKIMGKGVIPGTAYLEMASVIAKSMWKVQEIEFKDIFFLTPMFVEDDETKIAHTVIEKFADHLKFSVISKDDEDNWTKHVEGKIYQLNESIPSPLILDSLIKRYPVKYTKQDLTVTSDIFKFGPRWNTVVHAYKNPDDILIELSLADNIKSDVDIFDLHPSLLDNAVNILSQSFGEGIYLPLNYKSLKVFAPLPASFYSYVKRKNNSSGNLEIITFDISLTDLSGNVLADITDYSIKRVPKSTLESRNKSKIQYYKHAWQQVSKPESAHIAGGTYLIIHRNTNLSIQLINYYKEKGIEIIEADATTGTGAIGSEKGLDTFIDQIKSKEISRIISVLSSTELSKDYSIFCKEKEDYLLNYFYLIKTLLKHKVKLTHNITVLGENVNLVAGNENVASPLGNALFGLAGVVAKEYQSLITRMIDVDNRIKIGDLVTELESSTSNQIAYREENRYQLVLRSVNPEKTCNFELKDGGVYLITGGTGGLGLETARHLSTKNKIKLALLNRSVFPPKSDWDKIIEERTNRKLIDRISIIKEIEKNGSEVYTYSADVSNLEAMQKVINIITEKHGVLNGIIHAAGVAGDGFILNKSVETFNGVLAPKVDGLWILNHLTRNMNIDFTVLFSSIATIAYMQGQGDYTAANAFFDGYAAQYRQNTICVNWPGWKDTGMAADHNVSDDMALSKSLSTPEALEAFDTIMESGRYSLMPGILNMSFLCDSGTDIKLADDIQKQLDQYKRTNNKQKPSTNKNENVVIKGKREEELTAVEKTMAQIWACVLGLDEIDVFDSFQELGGDSILATHLLKALLADFPGAIDISDIFSYPSVVLLSELIEHSATEEAKEPELDEDQLKSMIDNIEDGNVSVDDVLDFLAKS